MKIIFSRKGWDSSAGGKPSPIFSGNGFSLPIPDDPPNPISYHALTPSALTSHSHHADLAAFLGQYAKKFPAAATPAHLDPDLDRSSLPRGTGWCPCFGQENGAATHLDNNGVGVGDIFVFYGWFDDVDMVTGWRKHQDKYCVFGYLQIGMILCTPSKATSPTWLHYHPHITNASAYKKNRIYVASASLTMNGFSLPAGGGILNPADPHRCLTKTVGKRGPYPDVLSTFSGMTKHRQEHVWSPKNAADVKFIKDLLS